MTWAFSAWDNLCRRLCLGKGLVRVCARKMRRKGVKSASPTREARPLTPQLAQKQLSDGFKASEVRPEAVPSFGIYVPLSFRFSLTTMHPIAGTHTTAQSPSSLQQALMKFIGQNSVEDVVFPFAIDLQILSGQALFLEANAFQKPA
ncbi:MAG: hypothetical protein RL145_2193 [Pseudomonadota bacterium]